MATKIHATFITYNGFSKTMTIPEMVQVIYFPVMKPINPNFGVISEGSYPIIGNATEKMNFRLEKYKNIPAKAGGGICAIYREY